MNSREKWGHIPFFKEHSYRENCHKEIFGFFSPSEWDIEKKGMCPHFSAN